MTNDFHASVTIELVVSMVVVDVVGSLVSMVVAVGRRTQEKINGDEKMFQKKRFFSQLMNESKRYSNL